MKMTVTIRPRADASTTPKVETTLEMGFALIKATAALFRDRACLDTNAIRPLIRASSISVTSDLNERSSGDLIGFANENFDSLSETITLLHEAERLLLGPLLDRLVANSDARFPVSIRHDTSTKDLLRYDQKLDVIWCKLASASHTVKRCEAVARTLCNISSHGYFATLEIDAVTHPLPVVSPTLFGHGSAPGVTRRASTLITGVFPVAAEAEATLTDVRENRTLRVRLTKAAAAKVVGWRMPIRGAASYHELVPALPLLDTGKGKIVIEDVWDLAEQATLKLD